MKKMAIAENIIPARKEVTGMSSAQGEDTNWKTAATTKMTVPVMRERVAPQKISPAITSSTFSGVAMIAS